MSDQLQRMHAYQDALQRMTDAFAAIEERLGIFGIVFHEQLFEVRNRAWAHFVTTEDGSRYRVPQDLVMELEGALRGFLSEAL